MPELNKFGLAFLVPNLGKFSLCDSFFLDLDDFWDLNSFFDFLASFSLLPTPNLITLLLPFSTSDSNTLGDLVFFSIELSRAVILLKSLINY